MKNKDFAVFILTHGRPDNVKTFTTLKKCGYTGRIYFIIDNEDKTTDKYIKNFGVENVIIFNKREMFDKVDIANNFGNRKLVVYARNASFDIARELGFKYFIELDDDYTSFEFRFEKDNKLGVKRVENLDNIFDIFFEFYKKIPAKSIAFAQGGDFIGGVNNGKGSFRFSKRKCMNSFFCSTEREFKFIGSTNEDVNAYVTLGNRGCLFLTLPIVSLTQTATQKQKGGLTDEYLLTGTYIKSFYPIMMHPSAVRIAMMNSEHPRIHHLIKWNNTTPMIIEEKYKK